MIVSLLKRNDEFKILDIQSCTDKIDSPYYRRERYRKGICISIHLLSNRSKMPFIRINCSTIPENLIESELFGYEKGSFTGALKEGKKGMFEEAEGGTILLDEIDSLPLSLQPKLLRVLQEKEFRRIGGSETINVDVRMIFTSNKDLFSLVKYGQFREDLYYRINVVNLNIPPLKDRKDDIPVLVEEFVRKFNSEFSLNILGVSDMTMELLMAHDWPGNVRELENAIERAFIYANGDVLTSEHFDIELPPEENNELFNETIYDGRHLREIVSEVERKAIGEALIQLTEIKRAAELQVSTGAFFMIASPMKCLLFKIIVSNSLDCHNPINWGFFFLA